MIDASFRVPVGGDISCVAPLQRTEGTTLQLVLKPQQVEEERLLRWSLCTRDFQRRKVIAGVGNDVEFKRPYVTLGDGTRRLFGGGAIPYLVHGDFQHEAVVDGSYNRVPLSCQGRTDYLLSGPDLKVNEVALAIDADFRPQAEGIRSASGPSLVDLVKICLSPEASVRVSFEDGLQAKRR